MAVSDRLRTWLARGLVKAMNFQLTPEFLRYSFMVPTFRALCTEGYKGNAAVFACVQALSLAFIEPDLLTWREAGGVLTQIPNHPLTALLRKPNPSMGGAALRAYTITYMAIGGNCYWLKIRSRAGRVVQIWPLHDGQMTPIPGGDRLVGYYELDNGSGTKEQIPVEDVVHLKWAVDPLQPWRGLAPLVSAAREVDTDNEATAYLFALLKNDAVPRLALKVPKDTILDDAKFRRLREQWQDRQGGDNRGKAAILEGGLEVEKIGLDLAELAFEALRRIPEARISAVFRTPPIISGLNVGLEQSSYSNYGQARRAWAEDTLVPLWNLVDDEVGASLLPDFGESLGQTVVAFDMEKVVALSETVAERRTWVDSAIAKGYMTVNEARAKLGLPPVTDGDVFLRPLNVVAERATEDGGRETGKSAGQGIERKGKRERRRVAAVIVAAQREGRREVGRRMEAALDGYFKGLAERVVSRAARSGKSVKALPEVGELLTPEDGQELETLLKRFYVELLQFSWEAWNVALGVDASFDLNDPAVTAVLMRAGRQVTDISDTTLAALQEQLRVAGENGWGVDHLVRGDPELGIPPLRDVIEETYKNRARTIARTELAEAQNVAAESRYRINGVPRVRVLDNGMDDSAEACRAIAGAVVDLNWMQAHPLGHPNCVRAFAPEYDDPISEDQVAAWEALGGDKD